jgi:predicted branched-subunit amino acid permease
VNRATATQSLSVSFTVGLYGVAFGAAGISAGFSILQTCLLSLLTFSGASQFAVVGVMGAGGSALSGIATASLLGIRNGLYGLRMAPILKVRGLKRLIAAQITIDESTGVAIGQEDLGLQSMKDGFWLTGFGVYIFWPRLRTSFEKTLSVCALILAVLLTPSISAGLPIIITAVLAVAFGWKERI